MVKPVLKKGCKKCGKQFFTYEEDKEFCNNDCEAKFKYNEHFGFTDHHKLNVSNCESCGELLETRGTITKKFCNEHCIREFGRRKRVALARDRPISTYKGKRLPYEVLNKIAEKKRVFEDHDWMYKRNRDKI